MTERSTQQSTKTWMVKMYFGVVFVVGRAALLCWMSAVEERSARIYITVAITVKLLKSLAV